MRAKRRGGKVKTQAQLRAAFWQGFPQDKAAYRRDKRQNDYNATIRSRWVDFVDDMQKDGQISEALVCRATL